MYFVGGASGAGKSSATRQLSEDRSIPRIELDDLQRLIMPAVPALEPRIGIMRRLALELVRRLVDVKARCIVEGGWLEPDEAYALQRTAGGAVRAIFCGYSSVGLRARYEAIAKDGRHWLARERESDAWAFLERQVSNSEAQKRTCEELRLPYVDFTSFADGARMLRADFEAWLIADRP